MIALVEDSEVESVVGKFGVLEMKENGRTLIELCKEKKLTVGNEISIIYLGEWSGWSEKFIEPLRAAGEGQQ